MKIHEIISEQYDDLNEGPRSDAVKQVITKGLEYGKTILKPKPSADKTREIVSKLKQQKQNIKAATPTAGLRGKALDKALAKRASLNAAAKRDAIALMKRHDKGIWNIIEKGVGAVFLKELYEKIQYLNNEYEAYLSGDKSTETFGDMSSEEAADLVKEEKQNLYGQFMLASGLLLRKTDVVFNLLTKLSRFAGGSAGAIGGYQVMGGFGALGGRKIGAGIAGFLPKMAGKFTNLITGSPLRNAAFMAFLASSYGQEFVKSIFVDLLVGDLFGFLGEKIIKYGEKGLQAAGIMDKTDDTEKSSTSGSTSSSGSSAQASDTKSSTGKKSIMKVKKDPNNPNIVYVNGQQISDANGMQIVQNITMQNISRDAKAVGEPDPTAGIKPNPKMTW